MEFFDQEHMGSPDCPYLALKGTICNKCGKEHEGSAAPDITIPLVIGVCQSVSGSGGGESDVQRSVPYSDWLALKEEVEQLRVQLAGCGVAAMQNTRDSVALRAKPGDYGWSASYGDVCAAVDREMDLRERLESIMDSGPVGLVSHVPVGADSGHFFNVNWLHPAALKAGSLLYIVPAPVQGE